MKTMFSDEEIVIEKEENEQKLEIKEKEHENLFY